VPIFQCKIIAGFIYWSDILFCNFEITSVGWIIGKKLSCINSSSPFFIQKNTTIKKQIHFCTTKQTTTKHKHLKSSDTRAANTAMVPFGLYADSVPFLAGKNEVPVPRAMQIQQQSHLSCSI